MKIIESRQAPNPRRVRVFLAEKNIEIEYEQLDLMKGEFKSPAFKALNPVGQVPVLVLDDGTAISETVAICRYFEELNPEPPLFGTGALGRAQVEMWNRRVELGLFFAVAHTFRHLHPAMKDMEVPQVAEWGEANRPRAMAALAILNDALADRQFLAGDQYSIADITALVAIDFMKVPKIKLPQGPDRLQHLERWYFEVSSRPSASA